LNFILSFFEQKFILSLFLFYQNFISELYNLGVVAQTTRGPGSGLQLCLDS